MSKMARRLLMPAFVFAFVVAAGQPLMAHFLWISLEPAAVTEQAVDRATRIHLFLNETPTPGGPQFLIMVRDVQLKVDGQVVPTTASEVTMDSRWVGKIPVLVDVAKDLGIKSREGKSYRLFYTARAQTLAIAPDAREEADQLRFRLVSGVKPDRIQVLFQGQPRPGARLKVYPETGDPIESACDEKGEATVAGLSRGKAAVWASWIDPTAGEDSGKPYAETRFYASLTFQPQPGLETLTSEHGGSSHFVEMTSPAVNSFGGAVQGDWLYVYNGHTGRTHEYDVNTTSRNFHRLNLRDRSTWEVLPMGRDAQGTALVSDGVALYRVGGMVARNQPGAVHDLVSVADFARFDPATRTWTDLAPLPQARSTHDAVIVGRTVFAVGGWEMKGATEKPTFVDHVAAFDLNHPENGWRKLEQPSRRRALSVAGASGKIYVLGGLDDTLKVARRVDIYEPATGLWTQGPDLPGTERNDGFGTSSIEIEGRPYFNGASGRIFRLNEAATEWEALGAWNVPRTTHRLLPGPDRTLLAVGGNSRGKLTAVIESVSLPPRRRVGAQPGE